MEPLKKDWITEGLIDAEYKKYLLLAYLKAVNANFGHKKLYPDLTELQRHYDYTWSLRDGKRKLQRQFSKTLSGIDWQKLQLQYESAHLHDTSLNEIEDILDFSIPQLKKVLAGGMEIYAEVEENLQISPIGIVPLDATEGYLFLYEHMLNETRIYQYSVTLFMHDVPPSRGVKTIHLDTVKRSLSMTFEQIKLDLVRKNKALPNPATYVVESRLTYPLEETLLPVAKKKVVKYIYS